MASYWHLKQGQSVHPTITVSTGTKMQSSATADAASSHRPHRTKPGHYCETVHVHICVFKRRRVSNCFYMARYPHLLYMQVGGCFAGLLVRWNMMNTSSRGYSCCREGKHHNEEWDFRDSSCSEFQQKDDCLHCDSAPLSLSSNRRVLVVGQKLLSHKQLNVFL